MRALRTMALPRVGRVFFQGVLFHVRTPGSSAELTKRVFACREAALAYIVAILLGCVPNRLAELGVALHETVMQLVEQPEHVVGDHYLSVAAGARADADGEHR